MHLFIQTLVEDPRYFVSVVATVIVSIILHELAHGVTAIRQGDDTPIHTGHMTANPLVHLGPFSIAVLLIAGIAWGSMPVDPTRFRSRFGEAIVSVAGPATNLFLALLGLTAVALMFRFGPETPSVFVGNVRRFLEIFGTTNLVLCMFNLIPVPPLDGSRILANFHRGYAQTAFDPQKQQVMMFAFILVFMFSGFLWQWAGDIGLTYMKLIEPTLHHVEAG